MSRIGADDLERLRDWRLSQIRSIHPRSAHAIYKHVENEEPPKKQSSKERLESIYLEALTVVKDTGKEAHERRLAYEKLSKLQAVLDEKWSEKLARERRKQLEALPQARPIDENVSSDASPAVDVSQVAEGECSDMEISPSERNGKSSEATRTTVVAPADLAEVAPEKNQLPSHSSGSSTTAIATHVTVPQPSVANSANGTTTNAPARNPALVSTSAATTDQRNAANGTTVLGHPFNAHQETTRIDAAVSDGVAQATQHRTNMTGSNGTNGASATTSPHSMQLTPVAPQLRPSPLVRTLSTNATVRQAAVTHTQTLSQAPSSQAFVASNGGPARNQSSSQNGNTYSQMATRQPPASSVSAPQQGAAVPLPTSQHPTGFSETHPPSSRAQASSSSSAKSVSHVPSTAQATVDAGDSGHARSAHAHQSHGVTSTATEDALLRSERPSLGKRALSEGAGRARRWDDAPQQIGHVPRARSLSRSPENNLHYTNSDDGASKRQRLHEKENHHRDAPFADHFPRIPRRGSHSPTDHFRSGSQRLLNGEGTGLPAGRDDNPTHRNTRNDHYRGSSHDRGHAASQILWIPDQMINCGYSAKHSVTFTFPADDNVKKRLACTIEPRGRTFVSFQPVALDKMRASQTLTRLQRWDPFWVSKFDIVVGRTGSGSIGKAGRSVNMIALKRDLDKIEKSFGHVWSSVQWNSQLTRPRGGEVRLLLRMLPMDDCNIGKKRADCHQWPKGTYLLVNERPIELDQRKQQSHDHSEWKGMCKHLDVSSLSRKPKTISISALLYDQAQYTYALSFCKYRAPSEVYESMMGESPESIPKLSRGEGMSRAIAFANGSVFANRDNAGVHIDSDDQKFAFSLLDPFSKTVITTPVRGAHCKHFQVCFRQCMRGTKPLYS